MTLHYNGHLTLNDVERLTESVLTGDHPLKELDLSGTQLDDLGMAALAPAISAMLHDGPSLAARARSCGVCL